MDIALSVTIVLVLIAILYLGAERTRVSRTGAQNRSRQEHGSSQVNSAFVAAIPDGPNQVELPISTTPVSSSTQTFYPTSKPLFVPQASPVDQLSMPTVIEGGSYLSNGRFRNTDAALQGREGELRVLDEITKSLDERWFVFRNVVLPGCTGDLDLILVGPGGTWVLEVKSYTGAYKIENGRWYTKTRNGYWAHVKFGPGAQVMENARRLCNFLKENGIASGNSVNRAVVVAKEIDLEVVSVGTEVWQLSELQANFAAIKRKTYHRPDHVQRIAKVILENANQPAVVH